ncbi:MAG: putative signal transducing protein [Candidatus Aquicultorales bacterium]
MFCIRCGAGIEEIEKSCHVCGAPLVASEGGAEFEEFTLFDLYDAAGMEWTMTPVAVLGNTAEVSAARGLLESSGIPVEVRAQGLQSMGVLVGGIELMVPEPLVDYAKEILVYSEEEAASDKTGMRLRDTELAKGAGGFGLLSLIAGALAVGFKALKNRKP